MADAEESGSDLGRSIVREAWRLCTNAKLLLNADGDALVNTNNYGSDLGWFYTLNPRLKGAIRADDIPEALKRQGIKPPRGMVVVDYAGEIQWRIDLIQNAYDSILKCGPRDQTEEMADLVWSLIDPMKDRRFISLVNDLWFPPELKKDAMAKIRRLNSQLPLPENMKTYHYCNILVFDSIYAAGIKPPLYLNGHYCDATTIDYLVKEHFLKKNISFNDIRPGDIAVMNLGDAELPIWHMGIIEKRVNHKYFYSIDTFPLPPRNHRYTYEKKFYTFYRVIDL